MESRTASSGPSPPNLILSKGELVLCEVDYCTGIMMIMGGGNYKGEEINEGNNDDNEDCNDNGGADDVDEGENDKDCYLMSMRPAPSVMIVPSSSH